MSKQDDEAYRNAVTQGVRAVIIGGSIVIAACILGGVWMEVSGKNGAPLILAPFIIAALILFR